MVTAASLLAFQKVGKGNLRHGPSVAKRERQAGADGSPVAYFCDGVARQPNRYSQGSHDIRIWQMLKKTVFRISILLLITSLALITACTNASSSSNPPTTTTPVGGTNAPQTTEKKESGGT